MQMFEWDYVRNSCGKKFVTARVRSVQSSYCKRFVSESSYADIRTGKSSYGIRFVTVKAGYGKGTYWINFV